MSSSRLILLVLLALVACNKKSSPKVTTGGNTESAPLLSVQWHLVNTGQRGADNVPAKTGEDINLAPVMASCTSDNCRGEGIRLVVVDDGLEIAHPEIAANIASGASWNYESGTNNPTNFPSDLESGHGTAVAGIVAARDSNSSDLRGVAPRVSLAGYALLNNNNSANSADAMSRNYLSVDISNNSWGPADNTGILNGSPLVWREAIDLGVTQGRGGKGVVYLWAAGNGGAGGVDDSNYDGFANYKNVIAVSAVDAQGVRASYSEPGANILVAAPGGEFCDSLAITTIDRVGNAGFNSSETAGGLETANTSYTRCMNGTSSATPMVAGVVALMLQANPNLTWRDVRVLLARSARKNHPASPEWTTNGAGHDIHPTFGFGVVDANAAIIAALGHTTNLPALVTHSAPNPITGLGLPIPDNNPTGVTSDISVTGSNINSIEFVEVIVKATHTYSGDLEITLTSPNGTIRKLSGKRRCPGGCGNYDNWVFGVVQFLDEDADGTWTLGVKDLDQSIQGTLDSWSLRIHGH